MKYQENGLANLVNQLFGYVRQSCTFRLKCKFFCIFEILLLFYLKKDNFIFF